MAWTGPIATSGSARRMRVDLDKLTFAAGLAQELAQRPARTVLAAAVSTMTLEADHVAHLRPTG